MKKKRFDIDLPAEILISPIILPMVGLSKLEKKIIHKKSKKKLKKVV